MLVLSSANGLNRFVCPTCCYIHSIEDVHCRTIHFDAKKVDDVLGGAKAWENVDQTEAHCPSCSNTTAFFMQIQTRSADEPSSIFYKCTNFECQFQWREQ
ncbi:hypothetical protein P9112_014038 [Eukaryota sp. TZLM1-RC]